MERSWQVADGFETVREMFADGAQAFGRGGGGYCAYLEGRPIVDLWAGQARESQPWRHDTSTVIMSATKGLAALCVQLLVDRGVVRVDAPVADIWPEFAQNGKAGVTLRHVLLHTAGLLGFPGQLDLLRLDGTGWDDHEAIANGLATAPLHWQPGSKHAYHALTVGWLLGEVVRRASGRSIGSFFADEVAAPLGVEAWIGTPDGELHRVAQVYRPNTERLPRPMREAFAGALAAARDPGTLSGLTFLGDGTTSAIEELELLFNNPKVLSAELPFGGATATARGLARMWALLSLGGELDGKRLLSEQSVRDWSTVQTRTPDLLAEDVAMPRLLRQDVAVPRTLGYLGNGGTPGLPKRFGPSESAYGAEGLGGQFAFCDPDNRMAVGYVRSDYVAIDLLQGRLTQEVYRCAARLGLLRLPPPQPSRGRALLQRGLTRYLEPRTIAAPAAEPRSSDGLLPHLRLLTGVQTAATRLGLAPRPLDIVKQSAAQRQLVKAAWWMSRRPSPGVTTREVTIPRGDEVIGGSGSGLRLRLYEPQGCRADGPAVLYIHGGGFVLGGLDAAHWLCNELAVETGMLIASVEYRLAPDDPHPAALDDCYVALRWLASSGIDPDRIAVAGDSAGGNLAAALTLRVHRSGGPRLAHQTLIYPLLDTRISSGSWERWAGSGINAEAGRMMVKLWVGEHAPDDPLVAPLLAEDLAGLPPAHIVLAECDVLYDDGAAYAARLREAGVPTSLTVYDRMPHGFLSINRLCPPARPAIRAMAGELARAGLGRIGSGSQPVPRPLTG